LGRGERKKKHQTGAELKDVFIKKASVEGKTENNEYGEKSWTSSPGKQQRKGRFPTRKAKRREGYYWEVVTTASKNSK